MRRICRPKKDPTATVMPSLRVKNKSGDYVVVTGFYGSPEWRSLRKRVIDTYGKVCMCCGVITKGKDTHVDHIQPRSKRRDLQLEFDNLQVLCKRCNDDKSDLHTTDYRPTHGGKTKRGRKGPRHWADGYTVEEVLAATAAVEALRASKLKEGPQ